MDSLVGVGGMLSAGVVDDLVLAGAAVESARVAELIQHALIDGTGATDRGVKQARFRVLRGARMPAVVVELGFISNEHEALRVQGDSYQGEMIGALIDAVINYRAWDELLLSEVFAESANEQVLATHSEP